MAKQSGTILVRDNEEWWNVIKTFESLFPKYIPKGRNVVIVTPGGGSSVNMTDILASHNLIVPKLTEASQEKLAKLIPDVNTSTINPIDLGALGFAVDVFTACVNVCIDDPNIDMMFLPLWSFQVTTRLITRIFKIQERTTKPIIFCFPSIADSLETAKKFHKLKKMLNRRRALYFLSLRDAAKSISSFCDYYEYIQSRNGEILKL
jgi:acyl-CoA synthetase (NDP forming)